MITSSTAVKGETGQQTSTSNAFEKLDLNEFLQLLVTELQNQDPMEPMDNSKIMDQVGQIKSIESNQRLSDAFSSLQLQQNIATGGSMIGKTITGMTDKGDRITGKVERVSVADKVVKLKVDGHEISMTNIGDIFPDGTTPEQIAADLAAAATTTEANKTTNEETTGT